MEGMTDRFALPLLYAGQAQKEVTHNEALAAIDAALHPAVIAAGLNAPPADPAAGECWIVGDAPSGAWSGHAQAVASWTDGGWRFVAPTPGMTAWHRGVSRVMTFVDGAWRDGVVAATRITVAGVKVVDVQQPAIAAAAGGATVDVEARATIGAILTALRAHGLIAV